MPREFKSCNFQYIFLIRFFHLDNLDNRQFLTCVVEGHSEGTVSQICYLGPNFHFIEFYRKLGPR